MGKSTNLKNQTSDAGNGSADSGNASAGNNPGATGLGLDGRRLISSAKPNITNVTGTIRIRVTVNADGAVTNASFVSSSGFGDREQEVREACLAASRQLKYNAAPDKPTQKGTITWKIH